MSIHEKILTVLMAAFIVLVFSYPPLSQDPAYHNFADQNSLWGIGNFNNVVSNLPFLVIGLWGLFKLRTKLVQASWKMPAQILSLGVILVCFGSAYYHHRPGNETLLWDRLPMTIAFMCLFSLVMRDYIREEWGRKLLWPALVFGLTTVFYWFYTEQTGAGDLRPYILVQFLPGVFFLYALVFLQPRHSRKTPLFFIVIFYGLAKIFEYYDTSFYQMTGELIGGHAIKHILAALGAYYALQLFLKRENS